MGRRMALLLMALLINGLLFPACRGDETPRKIINGQGGGMKRYFIGRFALDVPLEMKQAVQASKLRYTSLEDFVWPEGTDKEKARDLIWEKRVSEIRRLKPPATRPNVIITMPVFAGLGEWSRGILYFGNYMDDEVANLDLLVDFGKIGLWVKCDSAILNMQNEVKIYKNASNIAKSFRPGAMRDIQSPIVEAFYLKYGALYLPYLRQEKTYSRFEGHPLNLKLEVEMSETHNVEKLGVAERLAASIVTRYAPGVDVDEIRSKGRIVAGLQGEELVMRMSASGEDPQIQFGWEYRGKPDSGEHPMIQITMETPDGNLDEKLKVWDAILDSVRPVYR